MASHSWGTDRSIKEFLYQSAHRFDFFQAVKILEIENPEKDSVGTGVNPNDETVRFKSKVSLSFPPTDVHALERSHNGTPDEMSVNFMGMAGANSPLPASYAELILKRISRRDRSFTDFLDIFNHRLVSLMYRIRKKYHIGFDFKPPCDAFMSRFLYSLVGLGTEGLPDRMKVNDRALLYYAGLLNQQPHSMVGLETLLSHYFGVQVQGENYTGAWYRLEPDQRTHIGRRGQNQVLGENAVLGTRVWDLHGKFKLHIGPLNLEQLLDILPVRRGYTPLCQLTRYYVGYEFDFDINLTLKAGDVPESRLGGEDGPRLGWTSWLKTREFEKDDSQVTLTLRSGAFIFKDFKEI